MLGVAVEEENEMSYLRRLLTGLKRGITLACLTASLVIVAGQVVWSAPRPSGADLSITKTDSPDPVKVGQDLTYSISVTNGGPLTATEVSMRDQLPATVSFVSLTVTQGSCSGSSTVVCSLGNLGKGATAAVEIVVRANEAGDIVNTASVSGKQKDPSQANNQSSASTHVDPQQEADLSIAMTDEPDPYVLKTQPLTFTITVHNAGPSNVTSARIRNDPPVNVYLASITASQGICGVSYGIVNCDLGELAVGGTATVTISVWVRCGTSVINSALTSADEPDPVPDNNEATTETVVVPTNIFCFLRG